MAADRLLVATGDESAVSVRAVAAEVGCTAPAIYRHFADKRALINAVCDRHFLAFDAAIEAAGAGVGDPLESLRRRARAYVRFALGNPEPYRLIFMTSREPGPPADVDGEGAGPLAFRHLVEVVERCLAGGAFARRDPLLVATGLWTAMHGIAALAITIPWFPLVGLDALVEHQIDVLLQGLGTPGGAQRTSSTR